MEPSRITLQERAGIPLLFIRGCLDQEAGKAMIQNVENFLKQGKLTMIFDFGECSIVNSHGIASLFELACRVYIDFKGRIILSGLDQLKIRVFTMAGLIPMVEVASNPDQAISDAKLPQEA